MSGHCHYALHCSAPFLWVLVQNVLPSMLSGHSVFSDTVVLIFKHQNLCAVYCCYTTWNKWAKAKRLSTLFLCKSWYRRLVSGCSASYLRTFVKHVLVWMFSRHTVFRKLFLADIQRLKFGAMYWCDTIWNDWAEGKFSSILLLCTLWFRRLETGSFAFAWEQS